ncbi:MAG TPA: hypothetical protein VFE09_00005, partial [Rubrobacteraceae bacterium]|nr:hypothetical protein [Rubrobacteraceae bacterium]
IDDNPPGEAGGRRTLMPEGNRPPEDEQPLARPVHEQQLARPVSREQEEASQDKGEQQEARRTQQERGEAPQAEEEREGKGLIDKAGELIDEAKKKLTGG